MQEQRPRQRHGGERRGASSYSGGWGSVERVVIYSDTVSGSAASSLGPGRAAGHGWRLPIADARAAGAPPPAAPLARSNSSLVDALRGGLEIGAAAGWPG